MNKHDQKRREQLIGTLETAKEKAEAYRLYLTVSNNPDPIEIGDANLVLEHIEIALGHLGVSSDTGGSHQAFIELQRATEDAKRYLEEAGK